MAANGSPRLKLPQVTICSADSAFVELTAEALRRSLGLCEFGDAILFSDQPVDGPFRHVAIPKLGSIFDYSKFCLTALPRMIDTEYALVIQWDGYVVNPAAWRPAFLKYDYIGAVWPDKAPGDNVGNGGFSLRSARLLKALRHYPVMPEYPEDSTICNLHRPYLEKDFGIRFADERLAHRFSYEWSPRDSFGFHGFHNLWRYLSDEETVAVATAAWRREFTHWKSVWLLADAFDGGRKALAAELYAALRDRLGSAEALRQMPLVQDWRQKLKRPTATDVILGTLEEMCRPQV